MPAMNTRHNLFAVLFATLMGCGPTTINVTTGAEGGYGSTDGPVVGSTGLALDGSETGPVDTEGCTGASSSAASSSGDAGSSGGSTSTGEPPAECFHDTWSNGQLACWCGDVLSDPSACGCIDTADGCECPSDVTSPLPCLEPGCTWAFGSCYCDTQPADPSECDPPAECTAVQSDDGWACLCGGIISDPTLCGCVLPAPGVCSCPGGPDAPCVGPQGAGACLPGVPCCSVVAGDCVCDGVVSPGEYCECIANGALCLCGGVISPPESC